MDSKTKEKIFRLMLWKDILSIPVYTVIFNTFKNLFWILLILDRLFVLVLFLKVGSLEEFIDLSLDGEDSNNKQLIIFSTISVLVLNLLLFINNRNLFYILIVVEIADFIVLKLIKD